MKKILTTVLIAASAQLAWADALKDLDSFLQGTQTGRADFTQVVTAPAKDGQVARSKTSSGTFEFQRPGRFKFVYQKPFEQTIVADGRTLWLYDVDLNQVTSRNQAQALGSTPAALVAASANLNKLAEVFVIKSAADADGLSWVQATPRLRDGQIKLIRMGFAQGQLAVLDMEDSFGQRSTIRFEGFKGNAQLSVGHFSFKPPAGADVLKQ